jgi:4-amino-4-deoxy-L-arabinose transferase-like glycosyltransferase
MKPLHACLALVLLWACVYLPGLGSREIRGEEWRRTLPARTMLNTGEWIVPWSGGLPYVRKPPLINWASAASFKLTGVQNEWSARLPSVLLMLGGVLGIYAFSRRVMGDAAAFVGSVFFLTSLGCFEKGRLAEIEVYYIALTGVAFAAWLAGFMGKVNPWLAWLTAGFCLGLAFLAKGPVHLLFFYFIVIGACWATRRWREFLRAPHIAGLLRSMTAPSLQERRRNLPRARSNPGGMNWRAASLARKRVPRRTGSCEGPVR